MALLLLFLVDALFLLDGVTLSSAVGLRKREREQTNTQTHNKAAYKCFLLRDKQ